jgi:hypothetical protein
MERFCMILRGSVSGLLEGDLGIIVYRWNDDPFRRLSEVIALIQQVLGPKVPYTRA